MMPDNETDNRTADAPPPSAPACSAVGPKLCAGCDWWRPDRADTGWCDVFVKRTDATHGRQCTAWTPLVPLCDKCGNPGIFIRERPFADGSGRVFMCNTAGCANEGLYFYPPNGGANPTGGVE